MQISFLKPHLKMQNMHHLLDSQARTRGILNGNMDTERTAEKNNIQRSKKKKKKKAKVIHQFFHFKRL